MRKDKEKAVQLRKLGKTYGEINKALGIPMGTLSGWFKNKNWSQEVKKTNNEINISRAKQKILETNHTRAKNLKRKYEAVEKEAEKEYLLYKKDPLFMAGLMLYAGEGDRRSRHLVRVSNSEFYLHLVFIEFSEEFLKFPKSRIKFWLLLYPDHNKKECLEIWSKKTGIEKSNFHKTQTIQGRSKSKKLQYGVGNSIISSTALKKKMLKWLKLCKEEFEKERL